MTLVVVVITERNGRVLEREEFVGVTRLDTLVERSAYYERKKEEYGDKILFFEATTPER